MSKQFTITAAKALPGGVLSLTFADGEALQVDVTSETDPYRVSNTFMLPIARQTPRYARLSVSYDF